MSNPGPKRAGIIVFLVGALAILGISVLMLGRSHNLFSRKATLYTTFENVSGLVVGSPVRLAGVDVGMVRGIEFFVDKDHVERVRVVLAVERSALEHVRKDSIAQLTSKGLLGDMLINITIGGVDATPLADGDFLTPQPVVGLGQVVESVEHAIAKVSVLVTELDVRLRQVLTPEVGKDLGRIMHATAALTEKVERGDGVLHALIYEHQLADDLSGTVAATRGTMSKIETAVGHVEAVLAEVEKGGGLLHALVYDKDGAKIAHDLSRTAKELGDAVEQIRSGNGMLHSLIYEKEKTNLIEDLGAAAKIIRAVTEEVNQGKGTLGGLLKDPTVYQDLKTVLGNIKRNVLLKSIIRMTIEKDELKKTGEVKDE